MERYWVANGILVPNECGGLVKYDDAQATVEALQAQLESANTLLHKKNCAIGKAETTIEALQREHTQLQALVRALLGTWVNGRKIHDGIPMTLRQQIDATLDATTPAQTDEQRFIEACCERPHDCKWGGTGGCGYEGRKPKGGDGE